MIQLNKGKVEDALIIFGNGYDEIEEIEEFFLQCDQSFIETKVESTLEQNQIQMYTVERKKEVKVNRKKYKSTASVKNILESSLLSIEEEELSNQSIPLPSSYPEITSSKIRVNAFYFNRQMFNLFSTFDEITAFILSKKHPTAKNILVLEDIKDIFVAKHIRNAIQMTQQPKIANSFQSEDDGDDEIQVNPSKRGQQQKNRFLEPVKEQQDNKKRTSLQGGDADVQDWLCEIGIKYDFDYHFTYCRKETQEYFISCLRTTIISKHKREIGLYDSKSKEFSELANAEGLTGYYEQQWIAMLMSIHLLSEKKAVAIAKHYRTLKSLMLAYQNQCSTEKQRQILLSSIQYKGTQGSTEKSIGQAISKKVYSILANDLPDSMMNV